MKQASKKIKSDRINMKFKINSGGHLTTVNHRGVLLH